MPILRTSLASTIASFVSVALWTRNFAGHLFRCTSAVDPLGLSWIWRTHAVDDHQAPLCKSSFAGASDQPRPWSRGPLVSSLSFNSILSALHDPAVMAIVKCCPHVAGGGKDRRSDHSPFLSLLFRSWWEPRKQELILDANQASF